jgi:hypothetical protein
MCGIAGFTGFSDNIQLAEMANKVQKHRGADNQSVWNDEFIALAHQRLSVSKRGFLNYSFVNKLIENDRSGEEDKAYQIYQLLTLELWCREYLDKD